MAVGDIFQVTVVGEMYGQTMNMTMNYRQTAGSNLGPPAVGLADKVDQTWANDLLTVQSQDYAHKGVLASKIWPLPRELSWFVSTAPGPGLVASAALAPSVAPTVTKQTTFAGVRQRGRIYLTGIASSHAANGELTALGVVALQTATLQMVVPLTDLNGNTFQPCIYHRDNNTTTDIVFRMVRQVLRNQRRRQIGVGK